MNPLPLVIPPGLRFTCHGCGICCRAFTVQLDPGEIARIEGHVWSREGPRFREGFAVRGVGPWGEPRDELRKHEGACVFLDGDGLCLVEKRLGRAAKPRICRKFPFVFVAAPDGERVAVSIECGSRYRSIEDGAPVEAERADLEELRRASEPHRTKWRVQVAPGGRLLEPDEYLALERGLAAETVASRSLADTIRGLAAVAARAAEPTPVPAPLAPADWAAHLVQLLGPASEGPERPGTRALRAAATALASSADAWRDVLAAADGTPGGSALMRAALAGLVHEATLARAPTALEGAGRMLLFVLLAASLASVLDSGREGIEDVAPRDASERLTGAARLNVAARETSLLLRSERGPRLRDRCGGFGGVVSSFIP